MTNISPPTTLLQLVARSRKLGADRSIANWGGGNTSAKTEEIDFRGRRVRILWVKGSGSDLATVTEASFTGLYLDDVLPLLERGRMSDTEMVDYLAHCFYEPGRPRPSIETFLHGFLPFAHIDHTHADATNYFACAEGGEQLARDCFGDELIWIPYRRPGFGLAREVALALRARPHSRLVILAKHGLITWGETDEECYASTVATISRTRPLFPGRYEPVWPPMWRTIVVTSRKTYNRLLIQTTLRRCIEHLTLQPTPTLASSSSLAWGCSQPEKTPRWPMSRPNSITALSP